MNCFSHSYKYYILKIDNGMFRAKRCSELLEGQGLQEVQVGHGDQWGLALQGCRGLHLLHQHHHLPVFGSDEFRYCLVCDSHRRMKGVKNEVDVSQVFQEVPEVLVVQVHQLVPMQKNIHIIRVILKYLR